MTKLTFALVAALVLSSASAALAAPKTLQIPSPAPLGGPVTDEGYGRVGTVHAPGG